MKRKRLTGWKRMAAFAMALTLTVGDWTSAGAAGLPQKGRWGDTFYSCGE